jgi:predicted dithiol-disulfide oxidoreductase (DUF899 family)
MGRSGDRDVLVTHGARCVATTQTSAPRIAGLTKDQTVKHEVVDAARWEQARIALMAKEKELTRARDALSEQRRALPWQRVEKPYVFDGPSGSETLAQLFAGRSQLIVYHFMFAPDWEAGCKSCSFWADNIERNVVHLAHRDATMVVVSRAPLEKLERFRKRLGWTFKWVSSNKSDFNFDFRVSFEKGAADQVYNFRPKVSPATELPGISVFMRDDDGTVYRTYSTYARGVEPMNAAFSFLDLLPKGRDEESGRAMAWLRLRDEYDVAR